MGFFIPLIPAKAGTQCFGREVVEGRGALIRPAVAGKNWVPAFAGMSGNG